MRIFIIPVFFLFGFFTKTNDLLKVQLTGFAQGTTWHILYFAQDSLVGKNAIDSILTSIDSSLSIYKPYSLITQFNASEKGLMIDEHFGNVVKKSLKTWQDTHGSFDITVAPLVNAWGFGVKKPGSLPTGATIDSLKQCVGSSLLDLHGSFLEKIRPCVQVDVNGIAQGYSVDVVAAFLEKNDIKNYMVEIGGEVRVKGRKPDGSRMKIGIESPPDDDVQQEQVQQVIEMDSGAVTTSGNYRKYYESNGKKITHLIDPRTGYSIQNEMISATVYAKDAITADAYDNALMVMGVKDALDFVEARKDLSVYIIYKKQDGSIADTASTGFYHLIHP